MANPNKPLVTKPEFKVSIKLLKFTGQERRVTTVTQVMEGTIVVYIKTVDKMIPKISF